MHHGYEVQICDSQDEYHRTGAVYSLAKTASLASRPPGEWNTMEITLTDKEAADIAAWKNNARRNSFWNWPGWDAVLDRGDIGSRRKSQD